MTKAGKVWPHQIKAVIFDNDGVILDTLPLYYKALESFVPPPYDPKILDLTNGRSDLDVAAIYVNHYHLDMTPQEFVQRRSVILKGLFPNAKLIHGVERIIRTIHDKGIPLAVATSSMRELHEVKISNHKDIYSLFNTMICGNEVTKAKPSPEIFQTASKKLGDFNPENVLVFEDAFNGIKAANEAGMATCFLHKPFENNEEEYAKRGVNPAYQISSFDEFDFDKYIW
ncbi:haloacid dehalogenase-like hydrolase family protein [Histomonas meleagridis]|uniref:haloacid dehalogenase-like hydrolase family protein n=1 Tax=Histomonas meleagridis TaxID=135588 RepID=UPI00355A2246|nr:haloacid dehalogenase-like hydrolase family protein [Histomonas meleagridis]KAH0804077.1 haloacid dehalogenase-like hydrolase family protein [Histomonas meleagridis]